jgi:hypothetical protein
VFTFFGSFYTNGGTSASAPSFAGMVALLSQYLTSKNAVPPGGLGNINPTLYRLAQTSSDAFHDITVGGNIVPCVEATPDCANGSLGYSAGPGYDQATGLGSVDLNKLVTEWKSGPASATNLTVAPGTITVDGGAVQLTATVTASGGTPSGTVSFLWSENTFGTVPLIASGSSASATLSVDASQFLIGTHPVTAVYSGDNTFQSSAGTANVTVTIPSSGAAVAPFVSPNPVLQGVLDSSGNSWHVTLYLSEVAGVGASVTGLAINGVNYDAQLSSIFKTTTIPPHQTISGPLGFATLPSPATQIFVFKGTDVNGNLWTAQATAQFVATPEVESGIHLASTPATIVQNAANSACPWQQQLTIQNLGGNFVGLLSLAMDATDLTGQMQQIFGTTRIGPFGSLEGTFCRSDVSAPETRNFVLTGYSEFGDLLYSKMTATFQAAGAPPANMSVALGNSSLALNFTGVPPAWSISILPASGSTDWLTVSPASGTGPAQLSIRITPGDLGPGVYNAIVVVQSVNATPQFIDVPITMPVGGLSQVQIGGLANAASFQQAFAPGMEMSVYGTGLAPAGTSQQAGTPPLPLNLAGVSVTVNGQPAPLSFVSPGQLNIQVPYETSAGTAILGVNNNGQVAALPFQVNFVAPGIFTDVSGALSPNSSGAPGATVSAFITGRGRRHAKHSNRPNSVLPDPVRRFAADGRASNGHRWRSERSRKIRGCFSWLGRRNGNRFRDSPKCPGRPAAGSHQRRRRRRASRHRDGHTLERLPEMIISVAARKLHRQTEKLAEPPGGENLALQAIREHAPFPQ